MLKRIIGPLLVIDAPIDEDNLRATDMITLHTQTKRIACRVRRHREWTLQRSMEFTIRSGRSNGTKTEFEKILSGCADWMIYAWSTPDETDISSYAIIDLDIFRKNYQLVTINHITQWMPIHTNPDIMTTNDGTVFFAYKFSKFPKDMILSSYGI